MNNTQKLIIPVALLTVGVLLGAWHVLPQAAPSIAPNPTSAPQRLKGTIPPSGVYRFTPAPIVGTPEPNPTLTLQIAILDADTGQPVQSDVLINGVLARAGVDRVEIKLPGRTDGITITVQAEGYVLWSQVLSYKLDHSRVLYLQAELTPLAIKSGALPTLMDLPFHPTLTPASAQAVIALASPVPTLPTDTSAPTAALVAASGPPASPLSTPTHPHSPLPTSTPPPSHTPTPTLTPTPSNPDAWWTWPCNTPR